MRIHPVDDRIGFWAVHWPWWRTRLRIILSRLHPQVRQILRPGADRVQRWVDCPEARLEEAPETPDEPWVPPMEPDRPTVDRDWPSDQPPPPPPQPGIQINEDPRPREAGEYFDFLI